MHIFRCISAQFFINKMLYHTGNTELNFLKLSKKDTFESKVMFILQFEAITRKANKSSILGKCRGINNTVYFSYYSLIVDYTGTVQLPNLLTYINRIEINEKKCLKCMLY